MRVMRDGESFLIIGDDGKMVMNGLKTEGAAHREIERMFWQG